MVCGCKGGVARVAGWLVDGVDAVDGLRAGDLERIAGIGGEGVVVETPGGGMVKDTVSGSFDSHPNARKAACWGPRLEEHGPCLSVNKKRPPALKRRILSDTLTLAIKARASTLKSSLPPPAQQRISDGRGIGNGAAIGIVDAVDVVDAMDGVDVLDAARTFIARSGNLPALGCISPALHTKAGGRCVQRRRPLRRGWRGRGARP